MTRYNLIGGCAVLTLLFGSFDASAAETKKSSSDFKPLFNGKDFTGWKIVSGRSAKDATSETNKLFTVTDGMVHMYKDVPHGSQQPFGYIVTEEEYSNYHLRFQYKWGEKKFKPKLDAKMDAGLLYHVIGKDGVWPKSVECQIQETDTGDIFTVYTRVTTTADPSTTNATFKVSTNTQTGMVFTNVMMQPVFKPASEGGVKVQQGSHHGVKRVVKKPMAEVEGWNTVEVIIRGDTAVHIINGKTNNAVLSMEHMVDGNWVPLTKGKILLQQEGAEIFYRNIELKLLE